MAENQFAGLPELFRVNIDFASRRSHINSIPDHATLRALKIISWKGRPGALTRLSP